MDSWTAFGIFLMGAAIGGLLTVIRTRGAISRLRAEIEMLSHRERENTRDSATERGAA